MSKIDDLIDDCSRMIDQLPSRAEHNRLKRIGKVDADRIVHLRRALEDIANGEGYYGAQAREYKQVARDAIHDDNVAIEIADRGSMREEDE